MQTELRRFRFNRPQQIAALMLGWLLLLTVVRICIARTIACSSLRLLPFGLPAISLALALAAALWWVTRRQYGNRGGYVALGLLVSAPIVLAAANTSGPQLPAALVLYAGIYTLIGVAHAAQGPRKKMLPRFCLLTAILTAAALTHVFVLALTLALGVPLMLWLAEVRRAVVAAAAVLSASIALLLASLVSMLSGISLGGWSTAPHELSPLSPELLIAHLPLLLAVLVALAQWLVSSRTRYFGNTAPLLLAIVLMALRQPLVCVLPFVVTFAGGAWADLCESRRVFSRVAALLTAAAALFQTGLFLH